MGLTRRLRSGSARLVLGTSACWLLMFVATRHLWCDLNSLTSLEEAEARAEGNLPARKTLFENIGEGFENVQRGEWNIKLLIKLIILTKKRYAPLTHGTTFFNLGDN